MRILKKKRLKLEGVNTIAILADCGCVKDWEDHFPNLLSRVWEEHSPQLFIIAGDVALRGRLQYYRRIIRYMKKIPAKWIAVPGNHDRPLIVFKKYFGSVHKVIDIDKWRFIGTNTANKKFTPREARWLEKNISENSIIFSHIPPRIDGWTFYSLQEESSIRFLNVIKKNHQKIKAVFLGHIHGLSEKEFMDIPMIITGGAAHSRVIKNNQYNEDTFLQMMIFDVSTGEMRVCKMD